MLLAVTLLMILVCFVGACWCRGLWGEFSRTVKSFLLVSASSLVAAYTFVLITHWGFTSALANEILGSLAVGGYTLLILLGTLFRPKPLFYGLVLLFLLPVAAAFILLPLAAPSGDPVETQHIAGTLFVNKSRWNAGAVGSWGTMLRIYERPRSVPFIEHTFQRVRFDNSKCAAEKAFVVLQPDGRHVLARCPWNDEQHIDGFHDFLVPLY